MKYLCFAIALSANAFAGTVAILEQSVTIRIQGETVGIRDNGGDSFDITASSGTIADAADWIVTTPVEGAMLPLELHMNASATASTQSGPTMIGLSGSLLIESWAHVGFPYAFIGGSTALSYSVKFSVQATTAFNFLFSHDATHGNGIAVGQDSPHFELSPISFKKSDGQVVVEGLGEINFDAPFGRNYSISGQLTPGIYQLNFNPANSIMGDPLGEFAYYNFNMSLFFPSISNGTARVPDVGATIGLLVSAMFLLGSFVKFQKLKNGC